MPAHLNLTQEEWVAEFARAEQELKTISQSQREASLPLDFNSGTEVAGFIDHTLLKLDATERQVDELCEEAVRYGFKVGFLFIIISFFPDIWVSYGRFTKKFTHKKTTCLIQVKTASG